ncbi:MAG: hypothetical protein IKU29_00715 [Parabacteroides sp.]|nr:hypothetical protein [Parabacteroides sp.]
MDWGIIYEWLDQKAGVSYDPNEDLNSIINDVAFTDPFFWCMKISFILDDMDAAIETVDEYHNELTEELPPREKLKKGIEENVISHLSSNINSVKQKLGLSINPITDVESVLENATTLRDLIMTLSSFTIEELQKRGWFDEYEDQTDNALSETLEIHKNDLIDISQTIETIRENTFIEDEDEFDEDNEDDEDVDMEMEDYE